MFTKAIEILARTEIGAREWGVVVTDLTMLLLRAMWKDFSIWARKAIE